MLQKYPKWIGNGKIKYSYMIMSKKYAAKIVWKVTIDRSYIKCSCYKEANPNEKVYHNGESMHKGCEWKVKIKATNVETVTIKEGKNAGKNIQKPIFDDNVLVIVSKSQWENIGICNPSPQQQMVQKSHSGDFLKKISQQSLWNLCTLYKSNVTSPSLFVRNIIQNKFPSNKSVTKIHVYNMKRRVETMVTTLKDFHSY